MKKIDKYPILREIDRGGMGIVYLAEHPDLKIKVAIKTLAKRLIEDELKFVPKIDIGVFPNVTPKVGKIEKIVGG